VVVAALGLSALWVPRHPIAATAASAAAGTTGRSRIPARAWFVLAVFFVFLAGNIALWAFLERIGASLKISPAEMGLVFAVLKLLGGAAAFFCAWIGDRAGQRLPYWVVLAAIAAGLALIAQSESFVPFAIGVWLWEFAFTCGCVFQSALIARSDASGRAVVLIPAVFALGSMVGPAAAGYLVAAGSFVPLLLLALATSVVPVLAHALGRAGVATASGAARAV
jgi:predicted MFS family arabinose efflux permease